MRAASRSSSSEEMRETSPPSRAATAFSVEPSKNVSTRCRSAERRATSRGTQGRSEEHTSELQSRLHLVCRLLLEKKKKKYQQLRGSYMTTINYDRYKYRLH